MILPRQKRSSHKPGAQRRDRAAGPVAVLRACELLSCRGNTSAEKIVTQARSASDGTEPLVPSLALRACELLSCRGNRAGRDRGSGTKATSFRKKPRKNGIARKMPPDRSFSPTTGQNSPFHAGSQQRSSHGAPDVLPRRHHRLADACRRVCSGLRSRAGGLPVGSRRSDAAAVRPLKPTSASAGFVVLGRPFAYQGRRCSSAWGGYRGGYRFGSGYRGGYYGGYRFGSGYRGGYYGGYRFGSGYRGGYYGGYRFGSGYRGRWR